MQKAYRVFLEKRGRRTGKRTDSRNEALVYAGMLYVLYQDTVIVEHRDSDWSVEVTFDEKTTPFACTRYPIEVLPC
jgi:hypothetical protein